MKADFLKDKVRLAIVIIGLGALVGAYFFYDFYTGEKEQLDKRQALRQQDVEKIKAEVTKLKGFAENIQNIKREFRELNLQLESVLEYMPRSFNLAALLRKMTMLAQNSGVEITSFHPKKEEQNLGFYSAATIDFDVKGSFTQTLVFFDQLSRLKRIVNLGTVKMAAASKTSFHSGSSQLDTNVNMKTFRLTE